MMNLILASTSPYRKSLLERLGLPFEVESPGIDESHWKESISNPQELAVVLAREKARAVSSRHPAAVILGSDQVAVLGSEILEKPGDRTTNIAQLQRLSKQTHQLITAVCVLHGETERMLLDQTFLRMRELTEQQIEAYLELDRPYDCAGGYKFEAHGISLFEEVRGTDTTAIEGMPLLMLAKTLREFGFEFPQPKSL